MRRLVSYLLVAVGIAAFVVASQLPSAYVTAVRVDAVARTDLTAAECANGHMLSVAFAWHGRQVTGEDELLRCTRDYHPGTRVAVFVASNDPSNIGPTADWILHPDEHDPFSVFGPNDGPGLVAFWGVCAIVLAVVLWALDWRSRRRTVGTARRIRL